MGAQNKRLSKGKKGIKKKVVDPLTRKGMLPLHPIAFSPLTVRRVVRYQGPVNLRGPECWQDYRQPVSGLECVPMPYSLGLR